MSKKTYTGEERKAQLLGAGAKLAAKHGAVNVTRKMVADACKCAEGLVSVYLGTKDEAQKAYRKHMKKLGLSEPDKAKIEAIGGKLRAHGPREKRVVRKRSVKEVEAIKRNTAAKRAAVTREVKPATPRERKPKASPALPLPSPGKAPRSAPERKTSAARKPKAAPPLPMPDAPAA